MTRWLICLSFVTGAVAAGCDRTAPAATAAAPAAPAAVEPAGAPVPAQDVRGLVGQLGLEAAHRPKAGVTAEQLFDALDAAGVKLTARTQYVGATMNAAFCAGGRTTAGVVVAMCEYANDRDAEAGLRYMSSRFNIPTATREAHSAAVMTIVHPHPADDALVDRAFTTFRSL